jgi:hypothetical protein
LEAIELDFGHVEPAPVDWREVEFEFALQKQVVGRVELAL